MREDGIRRSLILADGGLPGLVVSALATLEGATPIWLLPDGGTRRRTTAREQAAALGVMTIETSSRPDLGSRASLLERAWVSAVGHGCERVVLAAYDEEGGSVADSAIAVASGRLTRSGHSREPNFVSPLIDLTIDQVAELALDLEVSADLCWWSERSDHLCDAMDPVAERWRWQAALADARRAGRMVGRSSG